METRLYAVINNTNGAVRLIEAANPAQALSHVSKSEYSVSVAKPKDIAGYIIGGAVLEKAGK